MTRETVFFETPARRAMSVMVSLPRLLASFAREGSLAGFFAPLTERLDVFFARLLIGLSLLRHRLGVARPASRVHVLLGDRTAQSVANQPLERRTRPLSTGATASDSAQP